MKAGLYNKGFLWSIQIGPIAKPIYEAGSREMDLFKNIIKLGFTVYLKFTKIPSNHISGGDTLDQNVPVNFGQEEKMKRVFTILLLVALFGTVAFAETLLTANPIGQGKYGILAAYLTDGNIGNAITGATIGGYVEYGITDKLDVVVNAGSMTGSNLPAYLTSAGMTAYGGFLKYTVVDETANMPAVAVMGGYKFLSQSLKTVIPSTINSDGNQLIIGAGLSKMMVPFVPYASVDYRSTSFASAATSTQLDATVGSAICWSQQGAVFVEYAVQTITPNGGSNYSDNQVNLGVGYRL